MSEDLIKIKNSVKSNIDNNELKIETGKEFRRTSSPDLDLHNFDFTKKIFFHPEKIVAYKNGERPFPTTIEIDLTNRCNHRCSFCFYAEHIGVEADKPSLKIEMLEKRLVEAKKMGTKAISFTGGGEPTIHPEYFQIIQIAKKLGFDIGTITNGSVITLRNVDILINNLQWIRLSISGGDAESYKNVQGVDQFEKILSNLKLLANRKKELNSNLNIGVRMLVTPENVNTLTNFATIIKKLNIDYFQIAPDQFTTDKGAFWNSGNTQGIFKKVKEILVENKIKLLTTIYMDTQESLDKPRTCYAHFFMITITAEGNLTFCKNARGEEEFVIGNMYDKSLEEIWNDTKTKEIENWVKPNNCGLFCKHMGINNTMEDILHPENGMSPNFVG
jgi:radical SAM protein with 4Fe4S-binding SPASM domain